MKDETPPLSQDPDINPQAGAVPKDEPKAAPKAKPKAKK